MPERTMRAKMIAHSVEPAGNGQRVKFSAVAKAGGYDATGSDEDNSFAHYTPQASLDMFIANPELAGKIKQGQAFYVDFTPVE